MKQYEEYGTGIYGLRHSLQWEVPIGPYAGGSVFVCPFCGRDIIVTYGAYDHDEVEVELRDHLLEEHPIRWRLSRRYRKAMRGSSRLARRCRGEYPDTP